MTALLEKAVAKARALPEDQQDALATLILEEIEAETHSADARQEHQAWSDLSLQSAMRGMEDEPGPGYSEADLTERFS